MRSGRMGRCTDVRGEEGGSKKASVTSRRKGKEKVAN